MVIPYGKQTITESDQKAIIEVLNSDFLTKGIQCQSLRKLQQVTTAEYASSEQCNFRVTYFLLGIRSAGW